MRRASARVALLLVTAATLLVGGATAASAHANLRSTDPAQSAVFPAGKPPAKVVLHFDEEVTVRSDAIKVFAPNGKPVAAVAVRSGTWKDVSATLPKLSDGSFVVIYRVVSDDGHPEQGAVTFTVGAATATNASINGLLAAQASPRGLGIAYGVVRALAFLGAMVFMGGLCFVRWCWPSVLRSNPTRRLLVTTGAVGIAAALLAIPFQAVYGRGGGFGDLFSGDGIGDVVSSRLGTSLLVRVVLLVVLVVVALAVPAGARAIDVLCGLFAVAVAATFAFAGHGYTGRWRPLAFGLDLVHLCGAGIWLGGLVVLAFALRSDDRDDHEGVAADRFSAIALPAIAAVVATGVVQAFRQIGSWDGLLHTTYSRMLFIKVLVVIAVIVVASAGRDILRDRAGTTLSGGERRELRTGIWIEVWLAVVILSVTAVLVNSAPAREAIAAAQTPTAHTIDTRGSSQVVRYELRMQPAIVGMNVLVVTATPVEANESIGTLAGNLVGTGGLPPIAINFTPIGNNKWVATAPLPARGNWALDLSATLIARPDTVRLSFVVG